MKFHKNKSNIEDPGSRFWKEEREKDEKERKSVVYIMISSIILAVEKDEDMDNIVISKEMTRIEINCQTTAASAC